MVNDLKLAQIRILTWGIYGLMAFLTVVTGWMTIQVSAMPKEYVSIERYKENLEKNKTSLVRIESKLDQLLISKWENHK